MDIYSQTKAWWHITDNKNPGSIWLRHQSDAKVSDQCQIDVGPRGFAVWDVSMNLVNTGWNKHRLNFYQNIQIFSLENKIKTSLSKTPAILFSPHGFIWQCTCRAYETDSPARLALRLSCRTANKAEKNTIQAPRDSIHTAHHLEGESWASPGPLFTKKTPSCWYRNPHYKPETVFKPSRVYNRDSCTRITAPLREKRSRTSYAVAEILTVLN